MVPHEHQWTQLEADGLGWRCECGELRDQPGPGHLWLSEMPEADHEHEFTWMDKDGWHCRLCPLIRVVPGMRNQ